jgi:hypothetical protein
MSITTDDPDIIWTRLLDALLGPSFDAGDIAALAVRKPPEPPKVSNEPSENK